MKVLTAGKTWSNRVATAILPCCSSSDLPVDAIYMTAFDNIDELSGGLNSKTYNEHWKVLDFLKTSHMFNSYRKSKANHSYKKCK